MAEHTPGPWHVGTGNGEGGIFAEKGRMKLEEGKTTLYPIATTPIHGGDYTTQDRANARLIAAAPALLDALGKIARVAAFVEGHSEYARLQECYTLAQVAFAQAKEVPTRA